MIAHLKKHFIRGLLALVPFALCYIAVRVIYQSVDQRVAEMLGDRLGVQFPGMGVLLVMISLYLIGLIASNVVGRQIFGVASRISQRVPLIRTVYQIGHQIAAAFSSHGKQAFKRCVLVEARKGVWMVGLVTGSVEDASNGQTLLKVYLPLPPNPTSGMFMLLPESEVRDPRWSVEEAMKMTMSAGIIGPTHIG